MTNLEKKNKDLGTNYTAQDMAIRMLFDDIEKSSNVKIFNKELKFGLFYMYQYWLLKEADGKEDMPDFISELNKEYEKAVKKQRPQKVKFEDIGYDIHHDVNVYACICPSCGLHIITFTDDEVDKDCTSDDVEKMFKSSLVHHAYEGRNNYCDRCGQKLNWGKYRRKEKGISV